MSFAQTRFRRDENQGSEQYAVAPQILQEFLHVATDPRRFEHPLPMEEALRRCRAWWEASDVIHCHPSNRTWELAWSWMEEFRLGRKRILDTYLAATYHERGIRNLATANAGDFAIFNAFAFEPWALALKEF